VISLQGGRPSVGVARQFADGFDQQPGGANPAQAESRAEALSRFEENPIQVPRDGEDMNARMLRLHNFQYLEAIGIPHVQTQYQDLEVHAPQKSERFRPGFRFSDPVPRSLEFGDK
jgi:hypothetical protein